MSYLGGRTIYIDSDGNEHFDYERDYEPKPTTNADHIRAMSDEELANWVCDRACMLCPIEDCEGRMEVGRDACRKRWLGWLKAEAEECE